MENLLLEAIPTENQHLQSILSTRTHQILKNNLCLEQSMTHNSTIDLTENNKCKPSGSQTWDINLQAITNNSNNNKKLADNKTTLHKNPSKSSKSINVPRKKQPYSVFMTPF